MTPVQPVLPSIHRLRCRKQMPRRPVGTAAVARRASGAPRPAAYSSLDDLHRDIDACRVCSSFVKLTKPTRMLRGGMSRIMIVGEGPGRSELKLGRAFAGQSGKTLDRWLRACGASTASPRHGVYLTSVIKCQCAPSGPYREMAERCSVFLDAQIGIIKPQLIITLGLRAYLALRFSKEPYSRALGHRYESSEYLLFTRHDHHFTLIVWPHPSGLNRQLNDPATKNRLYGSFPLVAPFLAAVP